MSQEELVSPDLREGSLRAGDHGRTGTRSCGSALGKLGQDRVDHLLDSTSFEEKYRELIEAVLDCPPLAGFCYTQLTDTGQETNGLLTETREPKMSAAVLQSINRSPSRAVPRDVLTQGREVADTSSGGGEIGEESIRHDAEIHRELS